MDEVTDRAVGLRHVGGVALCRHDVLHDVSAVAEVVEADHCQETQEEPEEEGRQPTGISLVGLHNLVRGATACKYNEFRPKAYIIGWDEGGEERRLPTSHLYLNGGPKPWAI